jgi:uncharacterized UBP type Zn finger protein
MDMGFSEDRCVEAYLVCNRDTSLAINFLLDGTDNRG